MRSNYVILSMSVCMALCSAASAQDAGRLHVGAARVNVTPPANAALPMSGYAGRDEGHQGIHDSLYYRILVLDDGESRAAVVVGDVIGIPQERWQALSARIENESGILRDNILLAGTHTHGAPQPVRGGDERNEKLKAYARDVDDRVVRGVLAAANALEPARMGVGRGTANVNINRIAPTAGGAYWLGQNPDGPSDKTVHVVRFDRVDGSPIAILINYAVHGTVGGQGNKLITADLPGATARVVEDHYDDDVVAIWTSGAAGDQNPIYAVVDNLAGGRIRPLEVQGQILGNEVVRVADRIETRASRGRIRGAQKVVRLPGKMQNDFSATGSYIFEDADSLDVRLSLLMINHVALTGISGEVLTSIGTHVKEASPFKDTIVITHANGSSGYLAGDEDYKTPGYEVMVTRVKEGAERAIVDGLLELMDEP